MTLNGVMALTLRYFTEFGKPAFQHIIATARIELIDQQDAQLSQRNRAAGCIIVLAKSGRLEKGDTIL